MNFSHAVKGCVTRGSKLNSIHSRAEIELGHKLSGGDISNLAKRFSIDYVFHTTEKVCSIFFLNIPLIICSPVWVWIPKVLAVSEQKSKSKM